MAFTSVTYTFANATTADATQVNQNFTDLINGTSDGTKNFNISALTCGGAATLNGAVTFGSGTGNALVFNGAIGSNIPVGTNTAYDFGTATLGLKSLYLGGSSTFTTRILGATLAGSYTLTLPTGTGNSRDRIQTDGSGVLSFLPVLRSNNDAQNCSLASSVGSNLLTVALKDASGADASSTSPVDIVFRNSTLATGSVLTRTLTAALSINTSAAGATLGHISGQSQYIYVWAIDNSGTIELALSGSLAFDEGIRYTTTAMSSGSTSLTTLYSTTSRSNVAVRLLGRLLSNQTLAGTYTSAVTQITSQIARDVSPRIEVRLDNGAGYGSTNTPIRRFSNTTKSTGNILVTANDLVNGASITILEEGIYFIQYRDNYNTACNMGISLNSSQLTTSISSITGTDVLALALSTAANNLMDVSCVVTLKPGDVLRAHTDGPPGGTHDYAMFKVVKICN